MRTGRAGGTLDRHLPEEAIMRPLRAALVLAATALVLTPALAQGEYDTVLVSRDGLTGPAGNDQSYRRPSISGDGRYIAFFTLAGNWDGGSTGSSRAYRKDTQTGELRLISRQDGPSGAPLGGNDPEISRDGRWACFSGMWVRDIENSRTYRIPGPPAQYAGQTGTPGTNPNQDDLTFPLCAISDDGSRVAFLSNERYVAEDTDGGMQDVYVWDRPTDQVQLVSRATGAAGADADDSAWGPVMTRDGRYVAFWSRASNLSGSDLDPAADVFVRDLTANTTTWVSAPAPGTALTAAASGLGSYDPAISDDGRYVAFSSWLRLTPSTAASATKHVFRRDLLTGQTVLVSRASGPNGAVSLNAMSENPSISPDGRYVAFESFADNLDAESIDGPSNSDVFIRDVQMDRTTLVSRASGVFGAVSDGYSFGAALAANNARVAFVSRGENLSPDDTALGDVFYRDTVGSLGLLPANLPGKPKITVLGVSGATTRTAGAAAARAARVRYRLSEFARMSVVVQRRSAKRWQTLGTIRAVGQEGRNVLTITSQSLGRTLRPGSFRAQFRATDFAFDVGRRTVAFSIRR